MIPGVSYSPQAHQHFIEVLELQSLQQRQSSLNHNPESPHRVEFYMLIQIDEGSGEHFIDFTKHRFEPGA